MTAGMTPAARWGALAAVLVIVFDQVSKWWILDVVMDPPRIVEVTGFINLVLVWNRGVSFGMFAGDGNYIPYLLSAISIIIVGFLVVWLYRSQNWLLGVGLGLIIGGALGNVVDRMRFEAVVDFVDIHVAGFRWPAFNVADAAITIGVIMLLADTFLRRHDEESND